MAIEMKAGNAQKGSKTARATAKKSPTAKITKAELKAKLRDIDIPDEELAKYFVVDQESSSGFSCLLYTSPSPRDATLSRMPSSA